MRGDADAVCGWFPDEKVFHLWSAGKLPGFPLQAEELNAYYDRNADAASGPLPPLTGTEPQVM